METLYPILLPIHSILRWLIILAGLFAIIRAITGINFRRPWENTDDKAGLWYTLFLDIQFLIGLLLYLASPLTTRLFSAGGAAFSDPATRFFGAEHVLLMLVGVILAHVGRSRAKRLVKRKAERKAVHRSVLIFFALSLVVILAGIPWPFMPVARGLLPF